MAPASEILQEAVVIRYETIAGFTGSTGESKRHCMYLVLRVELLSIVPGHPSVLVMGFAGKKRVPVAVICGNVII